VDVEWIPGGDPVPQADDDLRSPVAALGSVEDEDLRELVLQLLIDASDQVFGFSARAPSALESSTESGISLVQTGATRWMILADRR
jgi:hypothetical protein